MMIQARSSGAEEMLVVDHTIGVRRQSFYYVSLKLKRRWAGEVKKKMLAGLVVDFFSYFNAFGTYFANQIIIFSSESKKNWNLYNNKKG